MNNHDYGHGGWWWVWIIVIIIIIILIALAFAWFNRDRFGCDDLLAGPASVSAGAPAAAVGAGSRGPRVRFPPESVVASVCLSGDQEVPPVKTVGKGKGTVLVNSECKQVEYDIYAKKLSSDIDLDIGVHFHRGERGENGPVIKNLNIKKVDKNKYQFKGVWSPTDPEQPLTQKDLDDLLSGRVYVNVHTKEYPDGEIRGQVTC